MDGRRYERTHWMDIDTARRSFKPWKIRKRLKHDLKRYSCGKCLDGIP